MILIPLAVELTKVADIQDLSFSQAFENIYATLSTLKNEEEAPEEVSIATEELVAKKRRRRRVVCAICGEKFLRITPKHLKKHGITLAEYLQIKSAPINGNGAAPHGEV